MTWHRYKMQRTSVDEAFGSFCHRVGIPAIEEYMANYEVRLTPHPSPSPLTL